jgi:hypothetical protein
MTFDWPLWLMTCTCAAVCKSGMHSINIRQTLWARPAASVCCKLTTSAAGPFACDLYLLASGCVHVRQVGALSLSMDDGAFGVLRGRTHGAVGIKFWVGV